MPGFSLADRLLRATSGLMVLSALVWVEGPARYIGVFGVVPLLAGLLGRCPIPGVCPGDSCALVEPPQPPAPTQLR